METKRDPYKTSRSSQLGTRTVCLPWWTLAAMQPTATISESRCSERRACDSVEERGPVRFAIPKKRYKMNHGRCRTEFRVGPFVAATKVLAYISGQMYGLHRNEYQGICRAVLRRLVQGFPQLRVQGLEAVTIIQGS